MFSLRLICAVCALIAASTLLVSCLDDAIREHQVNYYEINRYLEGRVEGANVDELMSVAREWLESLDKTDQRQSSLVSSLRLFVSLGQLTDPATCNSRGYEILRTNNLALTGLARYGLRAIDRVGLEYAQRHAGVCCGKYEANYRQKMRDQVRGEQFERVKLFAHRIAEYALARNDYPASHGAHTLEQALRSSPINYIRLMPAELERRRSRRAEALLVRNLLREMSRRKEAGGERQAADLFGELLEEPCRHFADQIGPDVYEPVVLDEVTRLDSGGKVAQCPSDGPADYRLGLAYYQLCQMYILGPDNLAADLATAAPVPIDD